MDISSRHISALIRGFSAVMLLLVTFIAPLPAAAQFDALEKACDVPNPNNGRPELCDEIGQTENPAVGNDGILTRLASILATVVVVISIIIIIVAGLTMILSGGNSARVRASRDTIIYAAVAIIVVVLARAIVIYVVRAVGSN